MKQHEGDAFSVSHRRSNEPIERVYAIGDVHGRFDLFQQLIAIVEQDHARRPPASTQIILLGDIVDRGPDSAHMVRGCMKLAALSNRFMVLKGNHEEMMVEALTGNMEAFAAWLRFGGTQTLLSWGMSEAELDGPPTMETLHRSAEAVGSEAITWLSKLPLYHQHGDYLFVHAGIRPGVPLRRQKASDLLWIKDDFLDSDVGHGVTVVHGHSIAEGGPVVRANRIGIDTGAYRSERLTALGIEGSSHWILSTGASAQGSSEDAERYPLPTGLGGTSAGQDGI
ncbi:serine/threonine protein phosphatase 1 [Sphingomonas sp. SORGH_AS802]|uniref:metallophosphoesterase family protein n=1 Tax=unclassified Sphingomonas TaxID=196159 RepID=UPI002863FE58|nr:MULTISPECIES: metallophosphoesterase family protein [unclassified Sphingomonas]MDR6126849.1 serine/threonine protein phosphatase 1 [Sphingomonas sp. SORGH_AS_0438]MDR6134789.1 serine/threonine protein phosphatase 1 [Sphingomonas sp. SORGH_AS_0802]